MSNKPVELALKRAIRMIKAPLPADPTRQLPSDKALAKKVAAMEATIKPKGKPNVRKK